MNRRTVLKWLINAGGTIVAVAAGIPALLTALAPALEPRHRRSRWRSLGPVERFAIDDVQRAVVELSHDGWPQLVERQAVFVWRPSQDEIVVFSRSCTDLGCPITWDPGSQWFYCPCHGGIFAKDGERMAGPPKRPLYRYARRIRNGLLEIDLNSVPPMA